MERGTDNRPVAPQLPPPSSGRVCVVLSGARDTLVPSLSHYGCSNEKQVNNGLDDEIVRVVYDMMAG